MSSRCNTLAHDSSCDVRGVSVIPAVEHTTTRPRQQSPPKPMKQPLNTKPGGAKAGPGEHPAMNIDEGHLGGYIRSRHPTAEKFGLEHGDPSTWTPEVWHWAYDELNVRSVLDVGCGEGHAAGYFFDLGCRVLGIDGSVQARTDSVIPGFHQRHDFIDGPYIPEQSYDMVWSCEFVEHVEERYARNFLTTFSIARKYIMMTCAPPGQPGWHHVNCQPQKYWIDKVERLGFRHDAKLSHKARQMVEGSHFSRTGLIFVRDDKGD